MNKLNYKKEIEKQASIAGMATKLIGSNVGKAALKGAGKSAVMGGLVGAVSPVNKNPDGTKNGSRIKNAVGGAIGAGIAGGAFNGFTSAVNSGKIKMPSMTTKNIMPNAKPNTNLMS